MGMVVSSVVAAGPALIGTHCKENPIYVVPEKKLRGLSSKISTFMYLRVIYIFPRSVHLFSCSRIGRLIVRTYKSLTET